MKGLFTWLSAKLRAREVTCSLHDGKALALIGQGNALEDSGLAEEALRLYDAAIVLAPNMAGAHLNRGNALLATGDVTQSLAAFETALLHNPDYTAAHFNMGNAYVRAGDRKAAVLAYEKAIALKPDFADAEVALGLVLDDGQLYSAAIEHYQRAIEIDPEYAEVHCNLGRSLRELGRFDDAVRSYRRALAIKPSYPEGHNNLGSVLKDIGQLEEAQACYRRAIQLDAEFVDAHSNLLFLLNYSDGTSSSQLLSEAKNYGDRVSQRSQVFTTWPNIRVPERRLRIGFVSGDLREHPVGYFLESVLAALAKNTSDHLELFAYSNHFQRDRVTARMQAVCDGWRVISGLTDGALVERIRSDRIDILLDLSGHTAHNRLPAFALKPAPIQVSWLGYFGTTGLPTMDYLIADPWSLMPSEESYFTEKVWRLPETRLCFTPPNVHVDISALPALSNGFVTFGCFNNLTKMTDGVVALWARVLAAIPESRLLLKSPQLKEASMQNRIIQQFASLGIVAPRLILEGISQRAEYLACYQRVDIALDPFPFTGGTTTVEALWMGIPVLTLRGDRFLSRQGVGLLMNAGLPEWIALDPDDYAARAASHAADLQSLAQLRANLRKQVLSSPIFNATRFAHHFEQALRGMWRLYCSERRNGRP